MENIKKWMEEAFSNKCCKVVPIMTYPGIELCGRTVREAVTDGHVHAEAICRLNERYPADAVTAIMDLTVEAEAFGAKIVFPEDEIPSVSEPLLAGRESVESLQIPSLETARVSQYIKANHLVAAAVTDKPVFGGCIGPLSLAARLYGMSEIMIAMFTEPETVHLLLEKCTAFLMDYCRAFKAVAADGVIMAEPVAGLVSDTDCYTYSSAYVKQIADAVQDDRFLLVLHNCGNGGHCTSAMCHSGAHALHFGNKIDMVQALESVPSNTLVMGNLDPVGLFQQASSEEVFASTKNLLERTKQFHNFVLSTGCDIPPHIPYANIEAFYQAVAEYR